MQKFTLLLVSSCLLAVLIQATWAIPHRIDNHPSVFDNDDQFYDDYERDKRNYKLVKIELEKFKDHDDKPSCHEVVSKSPTLNFEIKKGFDLEKLPKSSSTELLNKFESLLDHLYSLKSDQEKQHEHGSCPFCKAKAAEFENPKDTSHHRKHCDCDYYAPKHDKRPHYHHVEEKHYHKEYETTTKKPTTTTTTAKPYKREKERPEDPYYLHVKKAVDDFNPKKAYVEKKTTHYEPRTYEKTVYEPKNTRFEAKKEKSPKYVEPYFYEKHEEQKKNSKPSKKEEFLVEPYYSQEKSYVKSNYEEDSYKKPTTPKPTYKPIERPQYKDLYYEKPTPKPHYENHPVKHSFEIVYSHEDPYYRDNHEKKYVPKVTTEKPTPKPHKTHKDSYPEPYYEFVKYLKKDYIHKYLADMKDYVHHGGKSDHKEPCQTKSFYELPVSYHPARYESLKRPDSPVADSTKLLKSLVRDDWPITVPVDSLKLHHSCKDKPHCPYCYKINGYLTKRRADAEKSEEDVLVKKEEVPEWVETKVIEDGGELHSLTKNQEEAPQNEHTEIKTAEETYTKAEYDRLVNQIKSEMLKIEKEWIKESIDKENSKNEDVEGSYDPESEADADIQIDRFKRSLFKKEPRKKDIFKKFKEPSKKGVMGKLTRNKKEKERAHKFRSIFRGEGPKKKGFFSLNH